MQTLTDTYGREHNYLRISLTERCNLNCLYCNPSGRLNHLNEDGTLLSYDELRRLIALFTQQLGFHKIRFTGGEPLVRSGVMDFFRSLPALNDTAPFSTGITTNGTLLAGKCEALAAAGIRNINISLDSLQRERFEQITGHNTFDRVMAAIEEAVAHPKLRVKLNAVIMRDWNEDEISDFVTFAAERDLTMRFIEFMPFDDNAWSTGRLVPWTEIRQKVEQTHSLLPLPEEANQVAKTYQIAGGKGRIGFISSVSQHFCGGCNRLRVSASGDLRVCLFDAGQQAVSFRDLLRGGADDTTIIKAVQQALQFKWKQHPDAEELKALNQNNMLKIGG